MKAGNKRRNSANWSSANWSGCLLRTETAVVRDDINRAEGVMPAVKIGY